MKFVILATTLFAGVALAAKAAPDAAETIDGLPECVKSCVPDALVDAGCDKTDYDCGCKAYGDVTLSLSTCLAGSITSGDCSLSDVNGELFP